MSSPILRTLGAIRQGVQACTQMREAAKRGLCINCQIRHTDPPAKLCDVCGEDAATGGVQFLAAVVEKNAPAIENIAHAAFRDFFRGK